MFTVFPMHKFGRYAQICPELFPQSVVSKKAVILYGPL